MDSGDLYLSDVHVDVVNQYTSSSRSVSRFQFSLSKDDNIKLTDSYKQNNEKHKRTTQKNLPKSKRHDETRNTCKRQLKRKHSSSFTTADHKYQYDEEEEICVPRKMTKTPSTCPSTEIHIDEDGDLVVPRQRSYDEDLLTLTLEHSLATELDNVGEQVWRGALLMVDFIIYSQSWMEDCVILDLGAGTGLSSIVAALFCKKVYCTDVGDNVLDIAQHNLEMNSGIAGDKLNYNFVVKELDWFKDDFKSDNGKFCLTDEEIEELKRVDILLAADVVYDDDITDAFFRTVHKIMSVKPGKTLYVSLEKRFVFTLEDLDITTPAYRHFKECLDDLHLLNEENGLQYNYNCVSTDFQQFINYNRTKELELWKITSTFPD